MNITRRTAIKTLAAAMFAPTINLRPSIDREALLLPFACEGHPRYDIQAPFRVGSLAYATDAKQICRAELPRMEEEDGQRRIPDVENLWRVAWRPEVWRPFELPSIESLSHVSHYYLCPLCGNRRVSLGEEYPPEGYLRSRRSFEQDYDTDDNTIRDPSCELCHGRSLDEPDAMMVDGAPFSYFPMRKIAALPNVQYCLAQSNCVSGAFPGDEHNLLLFQADGFQGMALGLNEVKERRA